VERKVNSNDETSQMSGKTAEAITEKKNKKKDRCAESERGGIFFSSFSCFRDFFEIPLSKLPCHSFEFLSHQLLIVVQWTPMAMTGNGEYGFDSGEGA